MTVTPMTVTPMTVTPMTVTPLRIRALAEAKGFNISTFARRASLSYTSASRLWHNTITQLDRITLDRCADALGVTVSALFGTKEDDDHDANV